MSKLSAILTITALASSGCDDHISNAPTMTQTPLSLAVAVPATQGDDPPAEIQAQRLTGLQRIKAVLDGIDWRCDEADGHKTRPAAIRLRNTLAVFERVCRDALAGEKAPQRREFVAELAGAVRAKISSCQRLGKTSLSQRATDLCSVTARGASQ